MIALAESCEEELNPYFTYLWKNGASKNDLAAMLRLPNQVMPPKASAVIKSLREWGSLHIINNSGLVLLKDLWNFMEKPLPEKIRKSEKRIMLILTQKAGFGLSPDYRFHNVKQKAEDYLVLFEGGHEDNFEPSRIYRETEVVLCLGALMAKAGSNCNTAQRALLNRQIEGNFKLSPLEKRSLHAYSTWCLNYPVTMRNIKKKLNLNNRKKILRIRDILIDIALADGKIDPTEIKQMERIYKTLDLDKSLVTSDIYQRTSQQVGGNRIVSKATQSNTDRDKSLGFQLDEQLLAHHESETRDVQGMLRTIFVDEDSPDQEGENQNNQKTGMENWLDEQHRSLYRTLITKEKWNRKEIEDLCLKLGIMTDGAIEIINDWAYERTDSPLLEDDEHVCINQEVLKELLGVTYDGKTN